VCVVCGDHHDGVKMDNETCCCDCHTNDDLMCSDAFCFCECHVNEYPILGRR
jgi:hypothetical protein